MLLLWLAFMRLVLISAGLGANFCGKIFYLKYCILPIKSVAIVVWLKIQIFLLQILVYLVGKLFYLIIIRKPEFSTNYKFCSCIHHKLRELFWYFFWVSAYNTIFYWNNLWLALWLSLPCSQTLALHSYYY